MELFKFHEKESVRAMTLGTTTADRFNIKLAEDGRENEALGPGSTIMDRNSRNPAYYQWFHLAGS
jgi:hypothetical protein